MLKRLLLVLVLCFTCGYVTADGPPAVTVPLQVLDTGHIAVMVKMNGKGPFRMVLDTGAPFTVLGSKAAKRLGLISASAASQPTLMGLLGMDSIKSLDVGGMKVKDLDVMIMDHPIIDLLAEVEGPLDGILGFNFYSRYRTTLDYAGETVSFTPVKYTATDFLSSAMSRMLFDQSPQRVITPSALWGLVVSKPDKAAGVLITKVYTGSAAEVAGLLAGDRMLTLDGRWTDSVNDCHEAAVFVQPGQNAVVKVVRAGKEQEFTVTPRTGL